MKTSNENKTRVLFGFKIHNVFEFALFITIGIFVFWRIFF